MKICSGRAAMGCRGSLLQKLLPNAVNNKGAVSPATRANASMMPVITPEVAEGRMMERVVRHLVIPSPSAASRMTCGTISSISSVVRVMIGTIMMPRATPPEIAEQCFCPNTTPP